ncbi:DUF6928 family protein [Chitinimonas sp.]|uniref:DUF6928 family protein n=1 Tax=Chitinimonas sp. TaxID=1934313 RepID=UPI002F94F11F
MGAKTWMLIASTGDARAQLAKLPALDRSASTNLAQRLFPAEALIPLDDGDLSEANPADDEILVGCFAGLRIVAAREFALDHPSRLPRRFLDVLDLPTVELHAMYSVVDWFAYARWQGGILIRSLSLAPDSGVIEDQGPHLPFEAPYWAGEHPALGPEENGDADSYPLPFHPLDLGEAALAASLGYVLEGHPAPDHIDPSCITLLRFKRSGAKPWWKVW